MYKITQTVKTGGIIFFLFVFTLPLLTAFTKPSAGLTITSSVTDVSCQNTNDGAINVSVTGGDGDYTYSWSGPGSFSSTQEDISGLSAGQYTLNVTDNSSNSATKSISVAVNDTQKPTIITKDVNLQLDASGNASIDETDINNGSSDSCGIQSLSINKTNFSCANLGANTVRLTVTDVNGNSASADATVTVKDMIPPTAIAQNLTIQLDASGNASITASQIDNGSTDNCSVATVSIDKTNFNCSNIGDNSVVLSVTDGSGNTATATATVTVEDITAPNVITKDISIQLDASGQAVIAENAVDNNSTDSCGSLSFDTDITSFDCNDVGENTVELTVTDGNGNSASKTATVTVEDNIAPNVITKNITVQLDASGNATIAEDNINNGSTDACGSLSFDTDITSFDCNDVGENTVELTVTDGNGNSASKTATVTVADNTNPTITAPADVQADTDSNDCNASSVNLSTPTTEDNCGVASVINDAPTDFPLGETLVTWTVTDNAGNIASDIQTVVVSDKTIPVISHNGNKVANNEAGACSASVNVNASATDNCSVGNPTGVRSDGQALNSPYPVGTTTITWNVIDDNGNNAEPIRQEIVIKDIETPTIPELQEISAECSVTLTPPTTTDNCDSIIKGSTGVDLTIEESGSVFWIFTDSSGNSTVPVEQVVTIVDTQAPVPDQSSLPKKSITGCQISSISELNIPTATDACEGEINGKLSDDFQFPYSFYGINNVTWEFIDSKGNISTQLQEIQLNPVSIEGGIIKGTFNSTEFRERIDISSCGANISVDLNLSGKSGNIIQWEKFAVNKGFWEVINNTSTSYTANFAAGAFESTYFRVLVKNGTCTEYSNSYFIRALPAGDAPTVTNLDKSNKYCLGEDVNLLAESNYLATQPAIPSESPGDFNQGQLNTQDPDSWLVDGQTGGFTAGGNSKKPRNWSGTNDHEFGGILFDSEDGKFAIAQGDFSDKNYKGSNPTTLESPIVDLSQAASANVQFDQAFYFANNDVALIEVSTDGGNTYSNLRVMHTAGSGIKKWFTAGTAQSTTGSNSTNYYFKTDNTSISLDAYIGQSEVRIRWSFIGTSDNSVWAMDNIFINNEVAVDTQLEWTNGIGNPEESPIETGETSIPINLIPETPGMHQYGATALINGCRTYDEEGTDLIDISVSYSYAGENIIFDESECGQNTVQLNAYDNTKTANENATKGSYPSIPDNCKTCDLPGSGDIGKWSWSGETPSCTEASFSDVNNPNATFTAGPGTYTLTWTVDGCSNDITVTIKNCEQVDFDGVDDFVDFGNNYDLDESFSLEVWIKPESLDGSQTIFSKRDSNYSGSAKGYDLSIKNRKVSFNWDKTGSIVSTHDIPDTNRWYHIALTHSSSGEYRLYIDGILMKLSGGGSPGLNEYKALLGAMDNNTSNVPSNYFHGWMEELRIWNVALSPDQLHLMMNQRIDKSAANKAEGKVVPSIPTNLNWNNLLGYYRFDDIECGSVNPYSKDGINYVGSKGRLNNITTSQNKSAPLPYESAKNGSWRTKDTWLHPDVWDVPNAPGINGEPINWNIVRTNHDIQSNNENIYLLGLLSESGDLEMKGENNNSGNALTISHYLLLDGTIDLNGESQLVQTEGSILEEASTGYLDRDQQGTANSYNYNYWTSPVSIQGTTNNLGYKIDQVLLDGTNPDNPQKLKFDYQYHWADGSYTGAKRISTYWFYSFYGPANEYGEWNYVHKDETLKAGQGYTMKGTSGAAKITDLQNYVFRGKPNNGRITLTISTSQNRLVGNPYPSAIDAEAFIKDNLKDVPGGNNSNNVFNGALYFWDHFGPQYSHVLEEYVGGYATYNLSGGVPAAATDARIDATGAKGSKVPGKYIPVAQAFFVNSVLDESLQSSSNITIQGGDILFKNSQRVFAKETNGDSQFLKPIYPTKEKQAEYSKDTRHKIRLTYSSPKGYIRQILVTEDPLTTVDFDLGYDAPLLDDNVEDMYWMIKEKEFVIQAVPGFDPELILPLGIKIDKSGEFSVAIEELENFETAIDIYLKDNQKKTYHKLNDSEFKANLEPGIYLERFEIVFQKPETEDPEEPDPDEGEEESGDTDGEAENPDTDGGDQGSDGGETDPEKPEIPVDGIIQVDYLSYPNEVALTNPNKLEFERVEIYSISGQKIMTFNDVPSQNMIKLQLNRHFSAAIYIVKAYCKDGRVLNKKFIIKR